MTTPLAMGIYQYIFRTDERAYYYSKVIAGKGRSDVSVSLPLGDNTIKISTQPGRKVRISGNKTGNAGQYVWGKEKTVPDSGMVMWSIPCADTEAWVSITSPDTNVFEVGMTIFNTPPTA